MYITIEGPIGVGKSSLTNLIAEYFDFTTVHEIVTDNPFLARFYEDQDQWAFQTEMYFLTHRYIQHQSISALNSANTDIVADYDIYKNIIFAKQTLNKRDYDKFMNIYDCLTSDLTKPDLVVFITASLDTLYHRISLRNRDFEQEIDPQYLSYLIDAYNEFINKLASERPDNYLVFNGDDLNFVYNEDDRDYVVETIKNKIKELKDNE